MQYGLNDDCNKFDSYESVHCSTLKICESPRGREREKNIIHH